MSCRVAKRKCVGVSCGRKCGICVIAWLLLLLIISIGMCFSGIRPKVSKIDNMGQKVSIQKGA